MDSEISDARRAAILEAAGALFVSKGFTQTTTLDVARHARVSKRELYRYFATKQGLLDALVTAYSNAMTLPPDLPRPDSRAALLVLLSHFGTRLLAAYLEPRRVAYLRLAIAEAPRSTALGQALVDNGFRPVSASLADLFADAAARGLIAAADVDLALEAYAHVLLGPWPLALLLGTRPTPTPDEIAGRAAAAVEVVRRVVGAGGTARHD